MQFVHGGLQSVVRNSPEGCWRFTKESGMKKRNASPTVLTLNFFRKKGVPIRVVERWVKTPTGGFRLDLWHSDLQALFNQEICGIQCGAGSHHSTKVKKALSHPDVRLWLASPSRIFWVMTWTKKVALKSNGERKKLLVWKPRVTAISMQGDEVTAAPFTLK